MIQNRLVQLSQVKHAVRKGQEHVSMWHRKEEEVGVNEGREGDRQTQGGQEV